MEKDLKCKAEDFYQGLFFNGMSENAFRDCIFPKHCIRIAYNSDSESSNKKRKHWQDFS